MHFLLPLIRNFFDKYGLSFLMVASYFGAGSIYIASQAGVEYGYTLLWAVLGAVILGFMAQDMSARLGLFGDTLMGFIHKKLGRGPALGIALFLSLGCIAWTLGLTAAVGKSVELLTGGAIAWQPAAVATGFLAMFVGVMRYDNVEKIVTAMMFGLLILYVVVAGVSNPDPVGMVKGFIPSLPDQGAFVLGAAILGTTALWPNFFLESILVKRKGRKNEEGLRSMRHDLLMGYTVGGLITMAIVVVAASVLRPAGVTELTSFMDPGIALAEVMGEWAMVIFLIGVIAASFNSIVPIMWTVPFMVLEALGQEEVEQNDPRFRLIFLVAVAIGTFSPLAQKLTGMSVIEMVTTFPALNGAFGLPLTAALLFWAVNDKKTMGSRVNTKGLNLVNISLVVFALYIAVRSAGGVFDIIFGLRL